MRQPWWEWGQWQYRASVAQANGAGGAIVVDFAVLAGQTMIIMEASGTNSGTNGLRIERTDEDNNIAARYSDIGSAGATKGAIPQDATNNATSSLNISSLPFGARLYRRTDKFTIKQTGAGAQNDTLIINLRALLSSATLPLIVKSRSTNQSDVTIATPTVNRVG